MKKMKLLPHQVAAFDKLLKSPKYSVLASAGIGKAEQRDTSYPNTYAYDLIRSFLGHNENGNTILSRSDAGQICSGVAKALGFSCEELACKLADYYKANESEVTATTLASFEKTIPGSRSLIVRPLKKQGA